MLEEGMELENSIFVSDKDPIEKELMRCGGYPLGFERGWDQVHK